MLGQAWLAAAPLVVITLHDTFDPPLMEGQKCHEAQPL
eukprot:COSAG05_NODE_12380_length_470_cov_0.962264_2_plen_37_part_01